MSIPDSIWLLSVRSCPCHVLTARSKGSMSLRFSHRHFQWHCRRRSFSGNKFLQLLKFWSCIALQSHLNTKIPKLIQRVEHVLDDPRLARLLCNFKSAYKLNLTVKLYQERTRVRFLTLNIIGRTHEATIQADRWNHLPAEVPITL